MERVEPTRLKLSQSGCGGAHPRSRRAPVISVMGRTLIVEGLRRRCNQALGAWCKLGDGVLKVMIRPVDMNPRMAARCSCLYTVHVTIPAGSYERVAVLSRSSNYGLDGESPIERVGIARRRP